MTHGPASWSSATSTTPTAVRAPESYPWHDAGFVRPRFNDLIVYQFHVGVFTATDDTGRDRRLGHVAKFLDALDRIEYLADLGVNDVQPLPFVEFRTPWSQGYNGTDIFSPEMDYCVGNKVPPTARNSATAWDSSRTVRMFEEQA